MTELVYKSLENIIPLLLTLVIITAVLYFFIKKITSPFSRLGNFLWDKASAVFSKIAQERKNKMQRQIIKLNIKLSDLENKYSAKTKYLLEIKDKLNDVSKYFTALNESEVQKAIFEQSLESVNTKVQEIKNSDAHGLIAKVKNSIKIRTLTKRAKKIELLTAKNNDSIDKNKSFIKAVIDELLASLKDLDVA